MKYVKNLIYWFKRKFWQIRNVIKWLPVIWGQFDFDYHYSLEVFKFQLKKQAQFLESKKSYTQSAPYNAQRIRTVLKLMDKVYDEEYALEYQKILQEKYGEDILDIKFVDCKSKPTLYEMVYKYESRPDAKKIEAEKSKLFKESHEKQEKAHKILWKLIEKDIRSWWD